MATQLLKSRLNRLVGEIPSNSFQKIDNAQWILKPNSYSKKGFLISGDLLDSCSYAGVHSFPVAIGYGLDEKQSEDVLSSCVAMTEEIKTCLDEGGDSEAKDLAEIVIRDVCIVLTSFKNSEDETLSAVVRRLPENCRTKYYKVISCLEKIKGFNANVYLANCCHKMAINKGRFSKKHLEGNKNKLLEDMRESYVPYMGNSTIEQDHWGMQKVDDVSLLGSEKDFSVKSSVVPYSAIHVNGLETLKDRLGIDLPEKSERKISPLKKKEGFEKAVAIAEALERVDDPRLEDGFRKLWKHVGSQNDGVNWDKVIAIEPDENPIIVPVIVEADEVAFPTDYSPLQALEVLDSLTDVTDYSSISGSTNIKIEKRFDKSVLQTLSEEFPEDKFPFGGQAPFSPPRRVNPEIR
jgi:hypothetical protein